MQIASEYHSHMKVIFDGEMKHLILESLIQKSI